MIGPKIVSRQYEKSPFLELIDCLKGEGANWRLHPLIYTFGSRKDTTTCGGGSERARVWIKVCNPQHRKEAKY